LTVVGVGIGSNKIQLDLQALRRRGTVSHTAMATDYVAQRSKSRPTRSSARSTRFVEVFPKRDLGGVIKQQAKLLARDLLKLTPPNSGLSLNTSFATQRKIGQNAVAGQVNSVFSDIRTLGIFQNPKKPEVGEHARQLLDGKRYDELQKFLVDCGYGYRVRENSVIPEPTEETHNKHRDRRGRVNESLRTKFWTGVSGSVAKFVKKKKALVGKEKAGWVPGARGTRPGRARLGRQPVEDQRRRRAEARPGQPGGDAAQPVSYAAESETRDPLRRDGPEDAEALRSSARSGRPRRPHQTLSGG
jgi:hypothetical protein